MRRRATGVARPQLEDWYDSGSGATPPESISMTDRLTPSDTLPGDELAATRVKAGQPVDRGGDPARPGNRAVQASGAAGRDGDRRHGRAADRADRHRGRRQPHHAAEEGHRQSRHRRQSAGAGRSRDRLPRQMGDARLHRLPCPCRRGLPLGQRLGAAGRLRLQALAGAWRHHRARDGLDERPRLDARPEEALGREQHRRAAASGLRLFPGRQRHAQDHPLAGRGRAWLRKLKERGADGVKFFGAPPAIMEAALDECGKLGLRIGLPSRPDGASRG